MLDQKINTKKMPFLTQMTFPGAGIKSKAITLLKKFWATNKIILQFSIFTLNLATKAISAFLSP